MNKYFWVANKYVWTEARQYIQLFPKHAKQSIIGTISHNFYINIVAEIWVYV